MNTSTLTRVSVNTVTVPKETLTLSEAEAILANNAFYVRNETIDEAMSVVNDAPLVKELNMWIESLRMFNKKK